MAQASETAAVMQALLPRILGPQPVRPRGDEPELLEYVLAAWDETEPEDAMHFQALTLLIGFLLVLVSAEWVSDVDEASDDVKRLASFDPQMVCATLEQSGVEAWCDDLGFPLRGATRGGEKPRRALGLRDAIALAREKSSPPEWSAELEAHNVLDAAVRKAIPPATEALARIRAGDDFTRRELHDLRVASYRLLSVCQLVGPIGVAAAAWSHPDEPGIEDWLVYVLLASLLGLNLRLAAATNSPVERSARLRFDEEDLAELTRALDRSQPARQDDS